MDVGRFTLATSAALIDHTVACDVFSDAIDMHGVAKPDSDVR